MKAFSKWTLPQYHCSPTGSLETSVSQREKEKEKTEAERWMAGVNGKKGEEER